MDKVIEYLQKYGEKNKIRFQLERKDNKWVASFIVSWGKGTTSHEILEDALNEALYHAEHWIDGDELREAKG